MTIAAYAPPDETLLLKQFCVLARGYFEKQGSAVEDATSGVPLENIYRMLEALRYDAFADCDLRIKPAMQNALSSVFAGDVMDESINEIEDCLRGLLKGSMSSQSAVGRTKAFIAALEAAL